MKPYSRARPPEENEPPLRRVDVGVGGQGRDRTADEARRLGDRDEVRAADRRLAPVVLGDAVDLEHHLRAHPPRRQRDGRAAVRRELMRLREREPQHGGLGQVVEGRQPVGARVVLERAVGHLDDQAAGPADQQRQREVARDEVRVDRQAQEAQAAVEVVLPDRRVPLGQLLAAPDVVDQHVEATLLVVDARDEVAHLIGLQVVDRDRDPAAAGGVDELGGLLDRLRPVVLGPVLARGAPGAVDGRARFAQRDGGAAPGTPARARHERHLPVQRAGHRALLRLPRTRRAPSSPCGPAR